MLAKKYEIVFEMLGHTVFTYSISEIQKYKEYM